MPSLVCASRRVDTGLLAVFAVRAEDVYRPDVLRVRASAGSRDVSARVRVVDLEWRRPWTDEEKASRGLLAFPKAVDWRIARLGRYGPVVDLSAIAKRTLVPGEQIECVIQNETGEPIDVSIEFEGFGVN